ncbi:MAG: IS1 family transposase [Planctomycetota bacterium]
MWSRLWAGTLVGARTYQSTKPFIRRITLAALPPDVPLITTDGFKFYAMAIRSIFGATCVFGQVIKKIRDNRVVRVRTNLVTGSEWRVEGSLLESADSSKVNTAFIELFNLTIRQSSAYLNRRSPGHARRKRTLEEHLELLHCHYNFCRPHGSLKFGPVTRAPAMQAGLARKRLTFREIFTARIVAVRLALVQSPAGPYHQGMDSLKCAA